MTAATNSIMTDQIGVEPIAVPPVLCFDLASTPTTIYGGTMAATNSSGLAVSTTADPTLKIWGRCQRTASNASPLPAECNLVANAVVEVHQGAHYYAMGAGIDAITAANHGQPCYAIDNQTVGLTDGGGTRPLAGVIVDATFSVYPTTKVGVMQGVGWSVYAPPNAGAASAAFRARGVATSIGAYTGTGTRVLTVTATGAIGAQDGLTYTAGQAIFIPYPLTNVQAVDSGPWIVTNPGATSVHPVFTRPAWYEFGSTIQQGTTIEIGGEGTVFANIPWKATCAPGQVVGTNDALFYPRLQKFTSTVGGSQAPTGLWLLGTGTIAAVNPTTIHAFTAVPTAAYGTGTIAVTGTASDVITGAVFNF